MARDWRKVALAVLTAVALASVCALDSHAQANKQPAKSTKSPQAKSPEAEAKQPEEGEDAAAKAPAKKKRQDPVEAQRAIEAATKLLEAGKADQAAQALTATLAGGNLPPPIMAKALYARGIAYRLQSKPAQAISDLTSALWLKGGLPEAERADALKQRAAAYSDAGLTESGEAVAATKERPASPAKSWNTATTSSDPAPTGQTGGNWFNNLFNLPASAAQPASPPPPPSTPQATASIQKADPPPAAAPPPAGKRISTAWSSTTQVHAERQPETARVAAAPPPPPPPSKAKGRFRAQIATVRTQQEAQALVAKAKREHAAALAAREPEIDQAVVGNMGSFYRVRVGPFATAQEAQAVCIKLKGSGFDCVSVAQ